MNHSQVHRPRYRESKGSHRPPGQRFRPIDPNRNYVKGMLDEMAGASQLDERKLRPIKDALQSGSSVAPVARGVVKPHHLERLVALQVAL